MLWHGCDGNYTVTRAADELHVTANVGNDIICSPR